MAKFDAEKWAKRIRKHKNPLVVAGEGCRQIPLNGKSLIDYVDELAKKLDCPVAATGNTILAMEEQGSQVKAKKIWVAELFRYLEDKWEEPLLEKRPDLLVMIGYHPDVIRGMVAGASKIKIAHLGPGALPEATLSMGEITLGEWKQNLDALIAAL